MRKGTISRIFILNAYYLERIAVRDFNLGVMILTLSCYTRTRKEFRATPTSGLGGASTQVDHVRKLPFYASLWQFTVWIWEVEGLNCLQTK